MSVPAAYLGVIVIWSTTPLAIQWSSEGWGFLFALTGRMVLAALLCTTAALILNGSLPWNRAARRTYCAAGLGIYGSMMCVYWGAQFIPSGLISVLFGLTPIVTGVLGMLLLNNERLTLCKFIGMLCGLAGLIAIFAADIGASERIYLGIGAVLLAVILHSLSAVLIKRVNSGLPALATTAGSLLFVLPLYLITWLVVDGTFPAQIEWRPAAALLYLGVCGSAIGFVLYFYVLKHMAAHRVALVTLITPVFALLVGMLFNDEHLSFSMLAGIAGILLGLAIYQWGDRFRIAGSGKSLPVPDERA